MNKPKVSRIKAAIQNWMGIPIGLTSDAFWTEWGGRRSKSGVDVTEFAAMQLDAVWACVRLISETIATLPLNIYEETVKGAVIAKNHPLQFIVHSQPNAETTASVHWEATVAAMLMPGNARAEKLFLGPNLVGIKFLDPRRLSITCAYDRKREYRYTEKDGTQRVIPNSRIWNIPGFSLDGVEGVSVIEYALNVFGNAIAAEDASATTFKNGLLQTIYYKMANFLKPKQRQDFKNNLAKSIAAGETPLLEGGMDANTLGIKPSDAQLLESRGFSVEAICRWFRVPPWMVGHTEKSTSWGTGIEQQMIGFLIFTLAPWLKRIEQAINSGLLQPGGKFYAKFTVEGLLRGDSAARAQFYSVMVNNGILTRDEVRSLEERLPMGGNAAVLTVQSAMTPLDSLGQSTPEQQVRASLRNLLGLDEAPAIEDRT